MSFSHENMDQLLDFSGFNIGSLIAIIQSTLDWLSGLTDLEFMSYEIPVLNMEVGELFDAASAFADKVQSRIDFEQINSVQDFIEQFTEAARDTQGDVRPHGLPRRREPGRGALPGRQTVDSPRCRPG